MAVILLTLLSIKLIINILGNKHQILILCALHIWSGSEIDLWHFDHMLLWWPFNMHFWGYQDEMFQRACIQNFLKPKKWTMFLGGLFPSCKGKCTVAIFEVTFVRLPSLTVYMSIVKNLYVLIFCACIGKCYKIV